MRLDSEMKDKEERAFPELSHVRFVQYTFEDQSKARCLLEEDKIEEAISFLERLISPTSCQSEKWHPRCCIDEELERARRLADPIHNDRTFRELLGIATYAQYKVDFPDFRPDAFSLKKYSGGGFNFSQELNDSDWVSCYSIPASTLKQLFKLWRLQDCLLSRLRVSARQLNAGTASADEPRVAHYCKTSAVAPILKGGLKLCAVSASNDPTEGKCLAKFLDYTEETEEPMLALQCSFSKRVDDLNQFRLYGRDPNTKLEGTGSCFVLSMNYFDDSLVINTHVDCSNNSEHSHILNSECKLPLYWVLYYDAKSASFYHTPSQNELFVSDIESAQSSEAIVADNKAIYHLLNEIKVVFAELATSENSRRLAWQLTIYLRHLIKDAAFRDEQEMRILRLFPFGCKEVKRLTDTGPLYADYLPVLSAPDETGMKRLLELIVGPKVSEFQRFRDEWKHLINLHPCWGVKITQSQVPLA